MTGRPIRGIDLGGTKIGAGLVDQNGGVRCSDVRPTLSILVRAFASASAQVTAVLADLGRDVGIVGAAGAAWMAAQRP